MIDKIKYAKIGPKLVGSDSNEAEVLATEIHHGTAGNTGAKTNADLSVAVVALLKAINKTGKFSGPS